MAREKALAEEELVGLLESAIDKVKHLRLDHVDEVTQVFEEALNYLESNLVVEECSFRTADRLLANSQVDEKKQLSAGSDHYIPKSGINPLIAKQGRLITTDYSSPSLKKRSLASRAGAGPSASGFGLGQGRVPSSRAKSSRAPQEDKNDSSDEEVTNPRSRSTKGLGFGGNSGLGFGGNSDTKPLKNKFVLGAKNFTRDTSSPSLGNRSLAARKAQGGGLGLGLGLGRAGTGSNKGFSSRAALTTENDTESDVAVAPAIRSHKQAVDPHASPAMMAASRNLIQMAGTSNGPVQEKTPKPAYLRRLDSPESNHAKLMKARQDLTKMIQKCLALVPRMDMDKYEMIKNKFETAFEKLDGGKIVPRGAE